MMQKLILAFLFCVCGSNPCHSAAPAFFAMDTGTRDAAHQTAEAQVALVKELGFDGIAPTYTTSEALKEMIAAVDLRKSKLSAIYLKLDLDAADPISPSIIDAIEQLRGRDTLLWLFVTTKEFRPSDSAGDARAVPVLRKITALAKEADLRVALYHHAGTWVERVEDATRLAQSVGQSDLGITFNLCHWLKVDGTHLEARLKEALPHLFAVTVNGADTKATKWKDLIQPLDSGTFAVKELLSILQRTGYQGPFGLQHYGVKGDARSNLSRSMTAWRKMRATLENKP